VFGVTNRRFTGAYGRYALAFTRMPAHKRRGRDLIESAAVPVVAVTARQILDAAPARSVGILSTSLILPPGLRIRVSVVRFRPWPPLQTKTLVETTDITVPMVLAVPVALTWLG
jgi:hypothetical protein